MSAKPADKVVICYDSKSHGKRRYFIAGPDKNPAKDGKPHWTYEKKEARVFTVEEKVIVASIMFMCNKYGYHGLFLDKPGPNLSVVAGTDLAKELGVSPSAPPDDTDEDDDQDAEEEDEDEEDETH